MSDSHENLLKHVRHCQESLDKYTENRNDGKLLHYLQKLYKLPIKVVHLEQTGVGRTVNGLRKLGGEVGDTAKGLVAKWKEMVVGEQEEEEDDDDDDDDDDEDEDDEDGYQTGDEQDSEKEEPEERKDTSSSHRKSERYSTDKEKIKHSSSRDKYSESSKSDKRDKERHKSYKRDSDDESQKKRHKKPESDERHKHKRKHSSDDDEPKIKEKKHKSEKKHKEIEHKSKHRESSSKEKDKHKSSKKDDLVKNDNSSKPKDSEKKSKHKDKVKDEKKHKKDKSTNGTLLNGIDSGSGASFAEALGMCEPSSSKNSAKKKEKEKEKDKKEKTKYEEPVPKMLKEPAIEPTIDINLSSLLPPITPNYRPLGNLMNLDAQLKRNLTESEALQNIITSKNQRTKVYSGNKMGYGKVSTLFELCTRVLQDNIDALEYTGGVPYNILKPILEKATPNQLYALEHHNPYLIEDTDELWQLHCNREFKNKKREEMETWREMYLRCLDERDAKLRALTANIKQSQDKSLPVRMTKLAYVDAVAKPPRNIARKQAKNGTAFDIRKASLTPSAKLTTLATSGEAGKVAVPNPGSRAVERSSSHATKPKKAPLMLKSISSFKNRFKR